MKYFSLVLLKLVGLSGLPHVSQQQYALEHAMWPRMVANWRIRLSAGSTQAYLLAGAFVALATSSAGVLASSARRFCLLQPTTQQCFLRLTSAVQGSGSFRQFSVD